jgi:hypothetical protein
LLHSPSSWVTACRVDRGVVMRGNSTAQSVAPPGHFHSTTGGNRKKLRSRGGLEAVSPLSHVNRHKQQHAGKTKTESKNKKTNEN